jgi:hypothetical protein
MHEAVGMLSSVKNDATHFTVRSFYFTQNTKFYRPSVLEPIQDRNLPTPGSSNTRSAGRKTPASSFYEALKPTLTVECGSANSRRFFLHFKKQKCFSSKAIKLKEICYQ